MKKIIQSFKKLYQFFFEFHPHHKELQKEYDDNLKKAKEECERLLGK